MNENENKKKVERNRDPWEGRERASAPWDLLFLSGCFAATVAIVRLRKTLDWVYSQIRSQSYDTWRNTTSGSKRGNYHEEAWNRYRRRMQEEFEDETERVERIRRMQNVFNRERSKQKKSYQSWGEQEPSAYQSFQRDDWYWKTQESYKDQKTNFRSTPRNSGNYAMSHHYSVLGLERSRSKPYSDAEIKNAFRAKAMKYHPDQNPNNKEAAEAKFKEVILSYEAIKLERKSDQS